MDLITTYLGLKLKNPLMVGASPLTESLDTVKDLEANGAAAVVMPSLYEERMNEIRNEFSCSSPPNPQHPGLSRSRSPLEPIQYFKRIAAIKKSIAIPVFASISCCGTGDWINYVNQVSDTGVDGLELNIYNLNTDRMVSAAEVEQRLLDLVADVRNRTSLPLAIKISPFYSSLPHLVLQLAHRHVNGIVLFSRAYQPDVDVESHSVTPRLRLSHASDQTELRLRLRWMAILSPQTDLSLAVTGGIHSGLDAIKAIMSGAHVVQIVSSLLNAGPTYMASLLEQFETQMRNARATSVTELHGSLNYAATENPATAERAHYFSALNSWQL